MKTATRLMEIARDLSELHHQRWSAEKKADEIKACIEAREIALIPADGWPGTNDTSRKAARERTLGTDEEIARLKGELTKVELVLSAALWEAEDLETERRSLESAIRIALAMAMGVNIDEWDLVIEKEQTQGAIMAGVDTPDQQPAADNGDLKLDFDEIKEIKF